MQHSVEQVAATGMWNGADGGRFRDGDRDRRWKEVGDSIHWKKIPPYLSLLKDTTICTLI